MSDPIADDSIDAAVEYLQADGWELVLERHTPSEVALLRHLLVRDRRIAIGGNAEANEAWAVDVSEAFVGDVQS